MPTPDETPETPDEETPEGTEETEVETDDEEPEADGKPPKGGKDDFENLSPRERALVQRARAQEKQKLYNDLKLVRQKNRELEQRLNSQPPRPGEEETPRRRSKADETDDLRSEIRALRQEMADREQKASMRAYKAEKIAEVRREGTRIIESLVMGDSEDEIDAAVEIAKAEAAYIYAEAEHELTAGGNGGGKTRTHVVREGAPRRPSGVTPTVSGAGSGDNTSGYSLEEIKDLASMESLRDGTWAAKRKAVLQALRQGHIR